jgi:hypothetical protein
MKRKKPQKTLHYGIDQKATYKPEGDVTQSQEYKEGALPDMSKYTVDKDPPDSA